MTMKHIAIGALLAVISAVNHANATDLLQAWQAAQTNERELAVARAAHASADPQRRQADALWRPGVGVTAAAGWGRGESAMRNAQFSAPGLGTSTGVAFGTSITSGTATRVALQASQPLYNPERRAQQQQLNLQADMGELQWQAAQQAAMLRTSQRYLDLAVAQEALRVVGSQLDAVQKAATEAQDRYQLGAAPITAVHEARAQQAQLLAQRLAAQTDLDIKRRALADATGLPQASLQPRLPANQPPLGTQQGLEALALWQERAAANNPGLRQLQLAADMARAEADKHRAGAAPKVDLVAQAEQQRLSGHGDYGSGALNRQTNAMLGVQLTVPLYTGGWRSAKEEESLAKWDQAMAQLDATREEVARQVHATWQGIQAGALRVQALQDALTAVQARQDATRTGYEVGHRTLLDVLNADNASAATVLALAQARSDLLIHRLQLAQLAGQLDEAALSQANQALAP
ncbi:MAG: TolC family protein [Proteobacteria bacterium]|nr:TolC family protein [Pseudomonadota bacterium]